MAKVAKIGWEMETLQGFIDNPNEFNRYYIEKLCDMGFMSRETFRVPGSRGRPSVKYSINQAGHDFLANGVAPEKVQENANVSETNQNYGTVSIDKKEFDRKLVEIINNPPWDHETRLKMYFNAPGSDMYVPDFVREYCSGDAGKIRRYKRAIIESIASKEYHGPIKMR